MKILENNGFLIGMEFVGIWWVKELISHLNSLHFTKKVSFNLFTNKFIQIRKSNQKLEYQSSPIPLNLSITASINC